MRRWILRLALALVLAITGFALVTALALEGQEVAVLRTAAPDGAERATRVWFVESAGALWVEAATPERPWYQDVLERPRARLERDSGSACVTALPAPGPEGHAQIRSLLRERYGWADVWVGLLQDTRRSIAVRLDPCPAQAG